jgi:hypothetical protein
MLLLGAENDALLPVAHEVWSQKKLAPLKAMDGKRVQFVSDIQTPYSAPGPQNKEGTPPNPWEVHLSTPKVHLTATCSS